MMHEFGKKHKRGLSKDKVCIVVAIDIYKNMVAIRYGNEKPTSKRIREALRSHVEPGCTIVHDGEHSHAMLIKSLECKDEYFKANTKDPVYLTQMRLVNNLCG